MTHVNQGAGEGM